MEAEGAEHPLAQFVESSEPTQHPLSVAAVSATVEPFVHPSLPDTTPSLVDSSVDYRRREGGRSTLSIGN